MSTLKMLIVRGVMAHASEPKHSGTGLSVWYPCVPKECSESTCGTYSCACGSQIARDTLNVGPDVLSARGHSDCSQTGV